MSARRRPTSRLSAVVVVAVALAVAGAVASLWRPLAPASPSVVTELDRLPADVTAAIAAYRTPRVVVALLARVLAVVVPLGLLLWGRSRRRLVALAGPPTGWRALAGGAAVAAALSLAVAASLLPLAAWAGIVQDGSWGLRVATAGLWWRDRLVGIGVEAVVAALVGAAFVVLLRRAGRRWPWHLVWVGTVATALAVVVWPVLVEPLFLTSRPLDDGAVGTAVEEVLRAAGEADTEVLVVDASTRTTRVNAMVTGLGPTRRVVLHDTLLERPVAEVRAVVAHELAHRRHRDLARGVLASATGLLGGGLLLDRILRSARVRRLLEVRHAADPRLVLAAVAALAVGSAVVEPVALWQSRRVEAAADHAALELTGEPAPLVAIQRTFAVRDLAAVDPPAWQTALLSTHPSVGERIRAAVGWAGRAGVELPSLDAYLAEEALRGVPWQRP